LSADAVVEPPGVAPGDGVPPPFLAHATTAATSNGKAEIEIRRSRRGRMGGGCLATMTSGPLRGNRSPGMLGGEHVQPGGTKQEHGRDSDPDRVVLVEGCPPGGPCGSTWRYDTRARAGRGAHGASPVASPARVENGRARATVGTTVNGFARRDLATRQGPRRTRFDRMAWC